MALPTSTRCAAARAMACFWASLEQRLRREARLLAAPGATEGQGAAVHALEQPVGREALDVAADRHVGDAESLDEVRHLDGPGLLDEARG